MTIEGPWPACRGCGRPATGETENLRGGRVACCMTCGQSTLGGYFEWQLRPPRIDDPCEYVRKTYGVPARVGMRVTVDGQAGVIVGADHRIAVGFDDGHVGLAHPTWKVTYEENHAQPRHQPQAEVAQGD